MSLFVIPDATCDKTPHARAIGLGSWADRTWRRIPTDQYKSARAQPVTGNRGDARTRPLNNDGTAIGGTRK